MKTIIACFLCFMIIGAQQLFAQQEFSWLKGRWKISDKNVYEEWTSSSDGKTLKGRSYRTKDLDTTITETITLIKEGKHFFYVPVAAGNAGPVKFKITSFSKNDFVAENPEHDFPKIIRYKMIRKKEHDLIEAEIEGDGKVIQYTFVRVE